MAAIGTSYSDPKALALHLKDIEKHPPEHDEYLKVWDNALADGLETENNE